MVIGLSCLHGVTVAVFFNSTPCLGCGLLTWMVDLGSVTQPVS